MVLPKRQKYVISLRSELSEQALGVPGREISKMIHVDPKTGARYLSQWNLCSKRSKWHLDSAFKANSWEAKSHCIF